MMVAPGVTTGGRRGLLPIRLMTSPWPHEGLISPTAILESQHWPPGKQQSTCPRNAVQYIDDRAVPTTSPISAETSSAARATSARDDWVTSGSVRGVHYAHLCRPHIQPPDSPQALPLVGMTPRSVGWDTPGRWTRATPTFSHANITSSGDSFVLLEWEVIGCCKVPGSLGAYPAPTQRRWLSRDPRADGSPTVAQSCNYHFFSRQGMSRAAILD